MLGDTNVGKTSLVLRFAEGYYRESSRQPTVGAFFITKRVQTSAGITCKVQIWDTAGQRQYRKMLPMYYKTAAAAIVCFDVTNAESWYAAKEWVDELKVSNENGDIVLAIVATKTDLLYSDDNNDHQEGEQETPARDNPESNTLQIQTETTPRKMTLSPLHESILKESKDLSLALDAIFVDTSSRNDENVDLLFQKVAEKVLLVKERNADSTSGMQGNIPVASGASVDALGRVVKTIPYVGTNGKSSPLVSRKSTNGNRIGMSPSSIHHSDEYNHNRSNSHPGEHDNMIVEDVEQIPGNQGNAGLCLGADGLFRCSSEKDGCIIS